MTNLKSKLAIVLISIFTFYSCAPDEDMYISLSSTDLKLDKELASIYGNTNQLVLPSSNDFSQIPSDPKNNLTIAKVELGKLLFHETGLAKNANKEIGMDTYSCASCHHAKAGFQSGIKQGIGEGGSGFGINGESREISPNYEASEIDIQPIRSPTILNTAYQDVMLWNGQFGGSKTNLGTESNWTEGTPIATNKLGFEGVEVQAIAGLGVHRLMCTEEGVTEMGYKSLFDEAFPESDASERYSTINAALAIAAYERTVLPSKAPFQKWLKGDKAALSIKEKNGAVLFFGKGQCYTCHSGPALSSTTFHALGMNDFSDEDANMEVDLRTKKGRGGFTKNPKDDYAFKTPTIYNLKDVSFLGHGGSFNSVKEIIEYKNKGISENVNVPKTNISSSFTPLNLTNEEVNELTAFVENGLYDANLNRYVPESLPNGNCSVVADEQSKIDNDCN